MVTLIMRQRTLNNLRVYLTVLTPSINFHITYIEDNRQHVYSYIAMSSCLSMNESLPQNYLILPQLSSTSVLKLSNIFVS